MIRYISNLLSFSTTDERLAIAEQNGEIYLVTKLEHGSEIEFHSRVKLVNLLPVQNNHLKSELCEIFQQNITSIKLIDARSPTEYMDGSIIAQIKMADSKLVLSISIIYELKKVGLDKHIGLVPYTISF